MKQIIKSIDRLGYHVQFQSSFSESRFETYIHTFSAQTAGTKSFQSSFSESRFETKQKAQEQAINGISFQSSFSESRFET